MEIMGKDWDLVKQWEFSPWISTYVLCQFQFLQMPFHAISQDIMTAHREMQKAVYTPCTHPCPGTGSWAPQLGRRLCTSSSSSPAACGLWELGTVPFANLLSSAGAAAHVIQLGANLS